MSLGISLLDSRQAFVTASIAVVISFVAAATRLFFLPSARTYRPFLGVLSVWAPINALPLFINSSSMLYFYTYLVLTPISWIFCLFASRRLYQQVFARYPGIAYAGKWSLNAAAAVAVAVLVGSFLFTTAPFSSSSSLTIVILLDRCILSGLALFLIILVFVISRYPITIQRNIAVHCLLFSALLLIGAAVPLLDQFTTFGYTARFNVIGAAFTAILCLLWTVLLNSRGDTLTVRMRERIDPALESRLLNQLDTLNGILLRAARK